jgi:hypothetical protein
LSSFALAGAVVASIAPANNVEIISRIDIPPIRQSFRLARKQMMWCDPLRRLYPSV